MAKVTGTIKFKVIVNIFDMDMLKKAHEKIE